MRASHVRRTRVCRVALAGHAVHTHIYMTDGGEEAGRWTTRHSDVLTRGSAHRSQVCRLYAVSFAFFFIFAGYALPHLAKHARMRPNAYKSSSSSLSPLLLPFSIGSAALLRTAPPLLLATASGCVPALAVAPAPFCLSLGLRVGSDIFFWLCL